MAVDFPGQRPSSLLMPPLPGVMVTVVTDAWEVTAATDRTREADKGSSLISPPFFSCRNNRSNVRKVRRDRITTDEPQGLIWKRHGLNTVERGKLLINRGMHGCYKRYVVMNRWMEE